MNSYFFPCLMLTPRFDEPFLTFGYFGVRRRLWETSTFDLATLATKHKLHLHYQLMDVYLNLCNLEFELLTDEGFDRARQDVEIVRALLYFEGVSPFVIPYGATHSINEYSGINSRDSEPLREKLPDELKHGLTSDKGVVEAWPIDLAMTFLTGGIRPLVAKEQCEEVAARIAPWKDIEEQFPTVGVVRRILTSAPMIPDQRTSILHIWQGIETLFPTVTAEVSFRIALLVAQLCSPVKNRRDTYEEVRAGYKVRSKITHGSSSSIGAAEWRGAWSLLCLCLQSILIRKELPPEDALMLEVMP